MTQTTDETPVCCPKFDPAPWDDHILQWNGKKFIKDHVFSLFFMPMNFGAVMKRMDEKVRSAGAAIPDRLCLSDHTSKWNMDVYLAVDRDIPGAENVELSGTFFSKVYEGPFKETGRWCKAYEEETKTKNMSILKWFMWYTTCPKCAKKYGKNYVAIVSQVA